jgi:hypothetical protein
MLHLFEKSGVENPFSLQLSSLRTAYRAILAKNIGTNDLQQFLGGTLGLGRLLVRLQPESGKFGIDETNATSGAQYAQPVFVIHDPEQILPKGTDLVANPLGPKHLRLHEVTPVPPDIPKIEDFIVSRDRASAFADFHAVPIDNSTPAMQKIDVGVTAEAVGDAGKGAIEIVIVTVQIGEDVARRPLQAFVNRVHLPAVVFAYPVGKTVLIFADNINATVRAAAIDDDILKVSVTLSNDRANRLLNIGSLVIGWSND